MLNHSNMSPLSWLNQFQTCSWCSHTWHMTQCSHTDVFTVLAGRRWHHDQETRCFYCKKSWDTPRGPTHGVDDVSGFIRATEWICCISHRGSYFDHAFTARLPDCDSTMPASNVRWALKLIGLLGTASTRGSGFVECYHTATTWRNIALPNIIKCVCRGCHHPTHLHSCQQCVMRHRETRVIHRFVFDLFPSF